MPTSRRRIYLVLLCTTITLMCVNFVATTGPGHLSYLVVGWIILSPLMLLLPDCRRWLPRVDVPLGIFAILLSASAILIHPDSFRFSTWAYSIGYCFLFAMTARLATALKPDNNVILRLIRIIVYAFFTLLVVQQICVIAGWPAPNQFNFCQQEFELSSFATEAAHLSLTLTLLIVFAGAMRRQRNPEENIWKNFRRYPLLWIAYTWCLFTTFNASAYLLYPLAFLPWMKRQYSSPATAVACGLVLICSTLNSDATRKEYSRAYDSVSSFLTFDEEKIARTDISFAGRAVPTIRAAKSLNPEKADFWIGHGTDASTSLSYEDPRINDTTPYVFHLWYNYGFFVWLAFGAIIVTVCLVPGKPVTWLFTLLAILLMGHNNCPQIWLILILAFIYRQSMTRA